MKTKILIGGGTGLVGSQLQKLFDSERFEVQCLSRSAKSKSGNFLYWDPSKHQLELDGYSPDIIINLAGAGIADSLWTKSRKAEIINSRIRSNGILVKAIEDGTINPKVFLSASAVGIYGDRDDELLTEKSAIGPQDRFMVDCCKQWENSVEKLTKYVDRVIKLRIGVVLSTKGGALPKILFPMRLGIAAYFGNGKQYFPWIHIEDLSRIIKYLIFESNDDGVINAVSPDPERIKNLVKKVKKATNSKALLLPAPSFILKLLMGKLSNVLLNSNRVVPNRLLNSNYEFLFSDLESAVKDLIFRKI